MKTNINNDIDKVVEDVIEEIQIKTTPSKKRQIKNRIIFVINFIIIFWSFIKCCNNKNNNVEQPNK